MTVPAPYGHAGPSPPWGRASTTSPSPEGRAWRPQPHCISLLFVGSQGKRPFTGWIYSAARCCHPTTGAFYSPRKAGAGRGRMGPALHPPPIKGPSSPLVTEHRSVKPHAKEFSGARRHGVQPCPCGSCRRPRHRQPVHTQGAWGGRCKRRSEPWQCGPHHRPSVHLGFRS